MASSADRRRWFAVKKEAGRAGVCDSFCVGWVSKYARFALILAATTAVLVAPGSGQAGQQAGARTLAPGARLTYHRETGEARFLTTVRGQPVPRPSRIAADAAP